RFTTTVVSWPGDISSSRRAGANEIPLPVGDGDGVALCAFAQTNATRSKIRTAVNRARLFAGDIDVDLSAGNVGAGGDGEDESGGRDSGGEKLRREGEDGVENITIALLADGAVVLR